MSKLTICWRKQSWRLAPGWVKHNSMVSVQGDKTELWARETVLVLSFQTHLSGVWVPTVGFVDTDKVENWRVVNCSLQGYSIAFQSRKYRSSNSCFFAVLSALPDLSHFLLIKGIQFHVHMNTEQFKTSLERANFSKNNVQLIILI